MTDAETNSREVRGLMETSCDEDGSQISWKNLKNEDSSLLKSALEVFKKKFGRKPTAAARAPGRVNLIGDHIDYCDGMVLPMAIMTVWGGKSCDTETTEPISTGFHGTVKVFVESVYMYLPLRYDDGEGMCRSNPDEKKALQFSTIIVGGYNDGTVCNVVTVSASGDILETTFHSSSLKPGEPSWANYIKGVVAHFPVEVKSFDAVIVSNVPLGAGLSSSAAIEVSMFTFLEDLTGFRTCTKNKALLCQKAEHTFPGMPCGIMDQFISVMGKKDQAMLLDCRSLETTHIPISTTEVSILVTNSNVKHQLTGSEYPMRRAQCEQAILLLGKVSMRDLNDEDLENLKRLNAEDDIIKRTQHVVSEISRTMEAAKCMKEGNFKKVGELFYESHESLCNLMEVSCPEIDALININKLVTGVLGARMTGGGFGGCTVSLVLKHEVENLKKQIRSRFKGTPHFFECQPCDGTQIILLK